MRKAFDWKRSRISVGSGSRTVELYSVSPDWFEYCFIYEKFVACRELLPFCENVFVPHCL
jgi:hypothetical protein